MDDRYELAERHGMSKEFIDWFFDEKKAHCGVNWFLMMSAMWEGWKASREESTRCINAAYAEGLTDVLNESKDERLVDLVSRRLLYAASH